MLSALRVSLFHEQRIVAVVEYVVFHTILSGAQAAWLMMATYPQSCDCLALLNALHLRRHDLGITDDAGSSDKALRKFDLTAVLTAGRVGTVRVSP